MIRGCFYPVPMIWLNLTPPPRAFDQNIYPCKKCNNNNDNNTHKMFSTLASSKEKNTQFSLECVTSSSPSARITNHK